jgi:hypothetical protein
MHALRIDEATTLMPAIDSRMLYTQSGGVAEASSCSAWGTSDITRRPADRTMWARVPADLSAAAATAAACPASPARLVVGAGGVNGVNVAAAAEAPA